MSHIAKEVESFIHSRYQIQATHSAVASTLTCGKPVVLQDKKSDYDGNMENSCYMADVESETHFGLEHLL